MKHNPKQKEFLEKQLALSKEQRELNKKRYRERTLNINLKKALIRVIKNEPKSATPPSD